MSKVSKLQFTRVKERKVENVSFSTVLKWILYRRIFDDLHLNNKSIILISICFMEPQ